VQPVQELGMVLESVLVQEPVPELELELELVPEPELELVLVPEPVWRKRQRQG